MYRSRTRFYLFALSLCFTLCFTMTAFAKDRSHRRAASESDAHRTERASTSEFTVDNESDPFDEDDEIEPVEPYVIDDDDTFGFSIRKTGNSGALKDSAVFRLYTTYENAMADEDPMIFSVDTKENIYIYCTSDSCPADGMTEKDIYAGKAYIKGLDPKTYYLVEVAAPKGYQKLPYVFRIIIEKDGTVSWREEVSGALETEAYDGLITIENRAIQLMPGTGGPGRVIFYIIGAICIMAAIAAGIHFQFFVVLLSAMGLGALLYPSLSSQWNAIQQSRMTAYYNDTAASRREKECFTLREAAVSYNDILRETGSYEALLNPEKIPGYEDTLDVTGTGIMGTIIIEKIGVDLPIYHGTDAKTLEAGAGHLEGTSLPIGGKGNHTVISAHSGFPGSRLFDDLDKLVPGDEFVLHVLGEDMVYEVDRTETVLPTEIEELYLCEGEDYCTLMTCTPYGINTHRLLVRGHRVYMDADGFEDDQTSL